MPLQKIIAITNQKGGVGKSTTAMHLGGALAADGFDVLIVNTDRQGSICKWGANAPENVPFPARVMDMYHWGNQIHRGIQAEFRNHDFTIIDCPPNLDSPVPTAAAMIADLVIAAMRPTTTDLQSLSDFIPVVERAMAGRDNALWRVLVTHYSKNAMSAAILNNLAENNIPVFKTLIGYRTSYTEGDPLGSHILAMSGVPAAAKREIKGLRQEVLEVLQVVEPIENAKWSGRKRSVAKTTGVEVSHV